MYLGKIFLNVFIKWEEMKHDTKLNLIFKQFRSAYQIVTARITYKLFEVSLISYKLVG